MATICTSKGIPILVDDEDHEWLSRFKWSMSQGYARTCLGQVNKKPYLLSMHKLLIHAAPGYVVDHIDHDRTNNRKANLRAVTYSQNTYNASKPRDYYHDHVSGKWWLVRGHDLIGIYDTREQAKEAWCEAEYGKTPSITNTTIPTD